jgi:hypothetical protein
VRQPRIPRTTAPLATLILLVSVWLGHTVEYIRVDGVAGLREELLGSVHSYMLPVALALLVGSWLVARRFHRAWQGLETRLAQAEARLRAAFRGEVDPLVPDGPPQASTGALSLAMLLLPVELGLYLLQENLEAIRAGLAAPGVGPLAGAHWAASLVHLGVLLLLCAGFALATRRLHDRNQAVEVIERLVRFVRARCARSLAQAPEPSSLWLPLPYRLFGLKQWGRPPPAIPQAT